MDSDCEDFDLRGIAEIQQSATEKDVIQFLIIYVEYVYLCIYINIFYHFNQIKTTYRKNGLQCHPDENPDNSKAARSFSTLYKLLTILEDIGTRVRFVAFVL